MTGESREYRCRCGGFLFASSATSGMVERVYCRKCSRRTTVQLGGSPPHESAAQGAGVRQNAPDRRPALAIARARDIP